MNNNTKNSFSASLNGKVYNNRKEFLNAIRSTKNNQIKDIRINETIEENIPNPTPEENTSAQKENLEQLDNLTGFHCSVSRQKLLVLPQNHLHKGLLMALKVNRSFVNRML